MSKLINLTQEALNQILEEFKETLSNLKMSDGKVTYTKTIGASDDKATLYFTELAWIKMQALVREFDKEVAWHGTAERVEGEENAYRINNILVYPQVVTGATVNTDQEEYQNWLYDLDDFTFNNLRMQGHSHVNMGTTPSSVDTTLYERFLGQLESDMFYIFLIWNKRGEKTIKIYDMGKNRLFETADVEVKVLDSELGLQQFVDSAKEMVKTKTYTYQPPAATTTPATQKKETETQPKSKKKAKKAAKKEQKAATLQEKANNILNSQGAWDDDDDYYEYGYYRNKSGYYGYYDNGGYYRRDF